MFPVADAYDGDPLNPDTETVTPDDVVAALSRDDRHTRMLALVNQAHAIYTDALGKYVGGREVIASCILFSGGNDSTTLAHLFRGTATHAIHANTGIGIEQTRQFVRDTCKAWNLPLIEEHPPTSYRDLVIERGFPGPAMHWKMYTRLKERCLMQARRKLITNPRKQRVVFIAGRRRAESERREDVPLYEPSGSIIWVSPFAMWTKLDLATYRAAYDVPHNEVADLIHMSGECLCGAFATPGELDEIGYWFPDVAETIHALEADVKAAGFKDPLCRWGHGGGRASKSGRLCSSCSIGSIPMFDEECA
jgi:3'-phosphoadenosine 5'-phosphosulfate sulfotransferase (PAPS reductase)/FAD synthetase